MTGQVSHAQAHEAWSTAQLAAFRAMNSHERLSVLKAGALDHWTEECRYTALDVLGEAGRMGNTPGATWSADFEPALKPLSPQVTRSSRPDRALTAAASAWAFVITSVAAHAYGFY